MDSTVKEGRFQGGKGGQENCRKFKAHELTSGMKSNATSKFLGHCFEHNFIWDQREGHDIVAPL